MKILLISILVSLSLCSYGQKGKEQSLPIDTIKGVDTVYTYLPKLTGGFNTTTFTLYYNQIGGTGAGELTWEGGILNPRNDDTLWVALTSDNYLINPSPNDTISIVDGRVASVVIVGTPFNYYRAKQTGTLGDTMKITPQFLIK